MMGSTVACRGRGPASRLGRICRPPRHSRQQHAFGHYDTICTSHPPAPMAGTLPCAARMRQENDLMAEGSTFITPEPVVG